MVEGEGTVYQGHETIIILSQRKLSQVCSDLLESTFYIVVCKKVSYPGGLLEG